MSDEKRLRLARRIAEAEAAKDPKAFAEAIVETVDEAREPSNVTDLGPNPTRDEVFTALRNGESDTMMFHISRENPQDGRTFSKEALEAYLENIRLFVVARMMAHWENPEDASKPGPQVLTTEVRVTVDGLHVEPDPDQMPWYGLPVDGSARFH